MKGFDFHVHTKYSYDSLMSIRKMIKIAKKRGLSGFAVVDHDVFSKENIKKELRNTTYENFLIIFGIEIKTNWGDLIALNPTEEINSKIFLECIDEIKEKDGISILPHPYRHHELRYIQEMIRNVEWIEIWNGRNTREQNNLSLTLKDIKPYTVGSDAHTYRELGCCKLKLPDFNNIKDIIKSVNTKVGTFEMKESPHWVHYCSSIIGTIKTGNYSDFLRGIIKKLGGGEK